MLARTALNQVGGGGGRGGGYSRYSSDGDNGRIFFSLDFSILGDFWVD